MIRQRIRQEPNTTYDHHDRQLPTLERLHVPHTQEETEERDESQEVDLWHALSPPRPRGIPNTDDRTLLEVGSDGVGCGV